jgi:hypothetical protein
VESNFPADCSAEDCLGNFLYYVQQPSILWEAEKWFWEAEGEEIVGADANLIQKQKECKDFFEEMKRNLNIANGAKKVLDVIVNIIDGKNYEFAEKVSSIRKTVGEFIVELDKALISAQEEIDRINKMQTTGNLGENFIRRHEK